MWNLAHLAKSGFLDDMMQGQDGEMIRRMLRACFSIFNDTSLIEDTCNAARDITERAPDCFNQRFYDSDTVKQLIKQFNRCNTQDPQFDFTKSNLVRIIGHMTSSVNVIEGMQTFFE